MFEFIDGVLYKDGIVQPITEEGLEFVWANIYYMQRKPWRKLKGKSYQLKDIKEHSPRDTQHRTEVDKDVFYNSKVRNFTVELEDGGLVGKYKTLAEAIKARNTINPKINVDEVESDFIDMRL
jgi:hypothetical protein